MFLPNTPFSNPNHFGVSFTATALRGIRINQKGQVASTSEIIFQTPLSGDGIDAQLLAQSITQLKTKAQFNGNYVAVSFPEKYAFSREYTFPNLNNAEIGEAIGWQIEKIFPFSAQDIYFDWKTLSKTDAETKILITAIQKSFLDQLKQAFEMAGLSPISFEPSASALSRLINPKDATAFVIIELDAQGTSSTLVVEGTSVLTTTTYFSATANPQTVLEDLKNSVDGLLSQWSKKTGSQEKISAYITGEKATEQLAQVLGQQLQLPVSLVSLPGVAPAFHLAYLAASTAVLPPESERSINLLPTSLQQFYQAEMKHTLVSHTTKVVSAALITSLVLTASSWGFLLTTANGLEKQKTALESAPVPIAEGEINIADISRKAQRYNTLFPLKITPEAPLSELFQQIPQNITLSSLTYDPSKKLFTVVGVAKKREDILDFRTKLETTGAFTGIKIPLSSLEQDENSTFELEFGLNPKKPK